MDYLLSGFQEQTPSLFLKERTASLVSACTHVTFPSHQNPNECPVIYMYCTWWVYTYTFNTHSFTPTHTHLDESNAVREELVHPCRLHYYCPFLNPYHEWTHSLGPPCLTLSPLCLSHWGVQIEPCPRSAVENSKVMAEASWHEIMMMISLSHCPETFNPLYFLFFIIVLFWLEVLYCLTYCWQIISCTVIFCSYWLSMLSLKPIGSLYLVLHCGFTDIFCYKLLFGLDWQQAINNNTAPTILLYYPQEACWCYKKKMHRWLPFVGSAHWLV